MRLDIFSAPDAGHNLVVSIRLQQTIKQLCSGTLDGKLQQCNYSTDYEGYGGFNPHRGLRSDDTENTSDVSGTISNHIGAQAPMILGL